MGDPLGGNNIPLPKELTPDIFLRLHGTTETFWRLFF